MITIIDNIDSFTYNVEAAFKKLGCKTYILNKNSEYSLIKEYAAQSELIVLSPGPGSPESAQASLKLIDDFIGKVPIFGVCLGMQIIAYHYGFKPQKSKRCLHGKSTPVKHTGEFYFQNIPNPIEAMRYNSLTLERPQNTVNLKILATDDMDETMSLYDPDNLIGGVQFHPDSFKTESGDQIFKNVLKMHSI